MHLEAGFDWSVMCRLLAHRDLASRIHVRNAAKATNPNRRECPKAAFKPLAPGKWAGDGAHANFCCVLRTDHPMSRY
jgi:hypothetical protein